MGSTVGGGVMAVDLLRLFAGRPLAVDRTALPGLAERAAIRLAGVRDLDHAREVYAASSASFRSGGSLSTGKVAMVHLTGFIDPDPFTVWMCGGTTPDGLLQDLRGAAATGASVIVMVVDSPGGSVDLIQETAAAIREIGAQTPIVAVARSLAASAAYWLASASNEIIASPSSQLGSIGVISVHYDVSGLNARIGVEPTYIYAGEFKSELNPDGPLSEGALAYQQAAIDETYATFVQAVARGRRASTTKVRNDFGKGRVMSAEAAVRAGLADRVDTLDNVVAKAGGRRERLLELSPVRIEADHMDLGMRLRRFGL